MDAIISKYEEEIDILRAKILEAEELLPERVIAKLDAIKDAFADPEHVVQIGGRVVIATHERAEEIARALRSPEL